MAELEPQAEEEFDIVRYETIERRATELFIAVWRSTLRGFIPERGPIADASLNLRDALNPNWPSDPDWLPEPLNSEREAQRNKTQQ